MPTRRMNSNALIQAAKESVAKHLDLPVDAIRIMLPPPSTKQANYNKPLGDLRRAWDDHLGR